MFWQKNQKSFFDYFEEHAQEIVKASKLLQNLFNENKSNLEISRQIKECEHRADAIIHQVISQINKNGFILPLDREDIFSFIKALDDVIDQIKDSAEAYSEIYTLTTATPYAKSFAEIIYAGSSTLIPICNGIRKPAKNCSEIFLHCHRIHQLENKGDILRKEALHEIFSKLKKNEIPIAEYTAWNDLYHSLEVITDKVEDCADIAEQMVLKYS